MDIQTCLQAWANHHGLLANDLDDTGLDRIEHRRHYRRNDAVGNIRDLRAEGLHHIFNFHTVLI